MRERYETLAIHDLREIAKIRGIKGASSMSKAKVIDMLVALDEEEAKKKEEQSQDTVDLLKISNVNVANEPASSEESKSEKPAKRKKASEQAEAFEKNEEEKPVQKTRKKISIVKNEDSNKEKKEEVEKPVVDSKPLEKEAEKPEEVSTYKPVEAEKPEEKKEEQKSLDSGVPAHGILEIMPDGYGFIRCDNFLPGADDVYVAPGMIRKYGLRSGDIIDGTTRVKTQNEKFSALYSMSAVNGFSPDIIPSRVSFENMTPIFPDKRIKLETPSATVAMRVMDLLSPVGKGQRGMIVSPPKAGKTTLLKEVAKSVKRNNPEIHMIILLIDERPEEVTDIREAIEGPNVEVIYSIFDELPEHHKRVSEMVIERAKRLVEHHKDVMILLDSITRLTRAYNLTVPPSGRTLSGGLDPAALHMPKRFFGAARNMREGGSLTILATALVETGSKMDDVVYEEFKGTGNMEMVLDRKLSEKRIFPAIDIAKSGTRRDDLLLAKEEIEAVNKLRKGINGLKPDESVDRILDMFSKTRGNADFINMVNKIQIF